MALCPFCFKNININKLDLRCSQSRCLEVGTTMRHIIPRKLAKTDRNGFGKCDVCGHTTHTLVCSECGQDLPDTIRESETKIISIVGSKGCGKSYYVATLLRQIMDEGLLARINRTATSFLPGSRDIYLKRYKENLDNRIPLSGTNFVSDIIKDNPPVLIKLTYTNSRNKKIDNTYSFFDAAGESFDTAEDFDTLTPYISHSEAIIIILDPRQIAKVNDETTAVMPGLPPVSSTPYSITIQNVATVLKNHLRLSSKKKIKIPLCIAFSKWDLLMKVPNLLPADFLVSKPSGAAIRGFDTTIVENISAEIRSLLNEWDPNFLATAEKDFETVRYFGFSAWGTGSSTGNDVPAIASFRVEDPMLWIMNQNGLL